jgi:hypothetical protein
MEQVVVVQLSLTRINRFAAVGILAHAGLTLNSVGSVLHLEYGPMLMRWLASEPTPEHVGTTSSGSEIVSGMLPDQVRL